MTEELVTLETAKLLKEKGFNEYFNMQVLGFTQPLLSYGLHWTRIE